MLGEIDSFDFVLARDLGRTLSEIRSMPQAEWVEWAAFYKYEAAMKDLAARSGGA